MTDQVVNKIKPLLTEFADHYGEPIRQVVGAQCSSCQGVTFTVELDDNEGCAARTCTTCDAKHPMLDSAEYFADADLGDATCPCGGEVFNVAVGFSFTSDSNAIDHVFLGLNCVKDGTVGCYADWEIDYEPAAHLLTEV